MCMSSTVKSRNIAYLLYTSDILIAGHDIDLNSWFWSCALCESFTVLQQSIALKSYYQGNFYLYDIRIGL